MPDYATPPVRPACQRLRAWRTRQLLFDTYHAHLYFPDNGKPLWAVPAGQTVVAETRRPVLIIVDGTPEPRS